MIERSSRADRDVVLVSMPFGPMLFPSIGLSLLQASLPERAVEIRYFTLCFADRIGAATYRWLAEANGSRHALAGEWVFRPALFPPEPGEDDEDYVHAVLLGDHLPEPVPAGMIERMFAARSHVPAFLDECVEEVLAYRPGVVGFTSVFQQNVASLALARRLKEAAPEVAVVFGGANCEGVMGVELVRRFPFVDAVVSGEGETVVRDLVGRLLEKLPVDDLPGVFTRPDALESPRGEALSRTPAVASLDALPYPSYDDYFAQWRELGLQEEASPEILFETSRGCWWGEIQHCTFCGLNGLSMAYRSKSSERALRELEELAARYPGLRCMVVDNILDMKYFDDLLPALAERQLDVGLFYEVKANLKKRHIRLLRDAGVTEIQPGIESLSTPVLKLMGKGVSALQNIQLLKWCVEIGVLPCWNLIWGFPGEPPEEYRRMAEIIPWLSHLAPPGLGQRIRIDRFSPNFDRSEEIGFRKVEPLPAYRYVYRLPDGAVRNLAYSFTFEYQDGRETREYTQPLAAAIASWRESHSSSALVYLDTGEHLVLWDHRPAALARVTVLEGVERALYLACDSVQGLNPLRRHAEEATGSHWSADQVEEALESLVERRLALREGNAFLSLAVPADGGAEGTAG